MQADEPFGLMDGPVRAKLARAPISDCDLTSEPSAPPLQQGDSPFGGAHARRRARASPLRAGIPRSRSRSRSTVRALVVSFLRVPVPHAGIGALAL